MGIDIHATWAGMTDEEREAQITGFSVAHGHVGYLREAYHGKPYATYELVPESWDHDLFIEASDDDPNYEGVEIKAIELFRRLPRTIIAALIREATLYKDGTARDLLMRVGIEPKSPEQSHPGHIKVESKEEVDTAVRQALLGIVPDMKNPASGHLPAPSGAITRDWLDEVIESVPAVASLINFVHLVVSKENETMKPVRIYNSF